MGHRWWLRKPGPGPTRAAGQDLQRLEVCQVGKNAGAELSQSVVVQVSAERTRLNAFEKKKKSKAAHGEVDRCNGASRGHFPAARVTPALIFVRHRRRRARCRERAYNLQILELRQPGECASVKLRQSVVAH